MKRLITQLQYSQKKGQVNIYAVLWSSLIYFIYSVLTIIISQASLHPNMFYMNDAIHRHFALRKISTGYNKPLIFEEINTIEEFWTFLDYGVMDSFYGNKYRYESDIPYAGDYGYADNVDSGPNLVGRRFFRDNQMLGPPRLRQMRVKENSCFLSPTFNRYYHDCFALWSSDAEETADVFKSTHYYTRDELGLVPFFGLLHTYSGGSYVQDLFYDETSNREALKALRELNWIDRGTRLVVFEFNVYNENLHFFCIIKMVIEVMPQGLVLPTLRLQTVNQHTYFNENYTHLTVAIILLHLVLLYHAVYMYFEITSVSFRNYIHSNWNKLNFVLFAVHIYAFLYNIWHYFYVETLAAREKDKGFTFLSLDILAMVNNTYVSTMGIFGFVVIMQLFKIVKYIHIVEQFRDTLANCLHDFVGFSVMFLIVFLSFASFGLMVFGSRFLEFSTFQSSLMTMVRMIIGDIDFIALAKDGFLGRLYLTTYILVIYFILTNMFVAVIMFNYKFVKALRAERKHETRSKTFSLFKKIIRTIFHFIRHCGRRKLVHPKLDDFEESESETSEIDGGHLSAQQKRIHQMNSLESIEHRLEVLEFTMMTLMGYMDNILAKIQASKRNRKKPTKT